jgi:hypothetical protein
MNNDFTDTKEMVSEKPVDYNQLLFLKLLDVTRNMTSSVELGYYSLMSFRPLLTIYQNPKYKASYKDRITKIKNCKTKLDDSPPGSYGRSKLESNLFDAMETELDALIDLAKHVGLLGKRGRRFEVD